MRGFAGSIVVRAAIVLFSVFCIFTIVRLQFQKNDLESQAKELSAQLEQQQQILDELASELSQDEYDEEYVKKLAKELLDYREPSEIVFYSGD